MLRCDYRLVSIKMRISIALLPSENAVGERGGGWEIGLDSSSPLPHAWRLHSERLPDLGIKAWERIAACVAPVARILFNPMPYGLVRKPHPVQSKNAQHMY